MQQPAVLLRCTELWVMVTATSGMGGQPLMTSSLAWGAATDDVIIRMEGGEGRTGDDKVSEGALHSLDGPVARRGPHDKLEAGTASASQRNASERYSRESLLGGTR